MKNAQNAFAKIAAIRMVDSVGNGTMSFSEFEGRMAELYTFLTKAEYFSFIHAADAARAK